jgi:hypothetical protein
MCTEREVTQHIPFSPGEQRGCQSAAEPVWRVAEVEHCSGACGQCLQSVGLPIIGSEQAGEELKVGGAELPVHKRDKA